MPDLIASTIETDPDYPGALLVEAVNRLALGLIIFDRKREILFCNQRYIEIYGLTPEQVKPGTPISEMIQHRLTMGLKVLQKPDEYIRERIGSPVVATTTVQEFADGRVIAYNDRETPTRGREMSVLEQLLGSISAAGALPPPEVNPNQHGRQGP